MTPSTRSDENRLVESFDSFFRREYRPVLGLAIVLGGDRWMAEDLVQEAFVAAERNWDRVGRMDNPEAWLRRVVANKSVSWFRRRSAEARALSRMPARGNPESDPELSVQSAEVWRAVRKLSRRQSQVVALTYLDDLSPEEIGTILGCSAGTVKTHLRRGRAALARRLDVEEAQS